MITKSKQRERICSNCGLPKPKGEFIKNNNCCSDCRRQYWRIYKQAQKQGEVRLQIGIEKWGQVDSVIREMAESQYKIQKEYAALEKRIALLKKYTEEIIEPHLSHQINLRSMLKAFLGKACPEKRAIRKRFDFGILRFCQGKLNVTLDAAYAGQRMGKP